MKKGGIKRLYSTDFKLQILKEYFETGLSRYSLCKKYGLPTEGGLIKSWENNTHSIVNYYLWVMKS